MSSPSSNTHTHTHTLQQALCANPVQATFPIDWVTVLTPTSSKWKRAHPRKHCWNHTVPQTQHITTSAAQTMLPQHTWESSYNQHTMKAATKLSQQPRHSDCDCYKTKSLSIRCHCLHRCLAGSGTGHHPMQYSSKRARNQIWSLIMINCTARKRLCWGNCPTWQVAVHRHSNAYCKTAGCNHIKQHDTVAMFSIYTTRFHWRNNHLSSINWQERLCLDKKTRDIWQNSMST